MRTRFPFPFALVLVLSLAAAGCIHKPPPEPPPEPPPPYDLSAEQASGFVELSLACTARLFPNKPSHVYHAADQVRPPQQDTPAFYGCFDWHSAVHGHWAILRLLRRFPDLPEAAAIRARLNEHLTAEKLQRELAFFQQERSALFERPYGWAWFSRLYAEAATFEDPDAKRWASALKPLADHLSRATKTYLDKLSVPIRAGTHPNTAFALAHMLDAARATGDTDLEAAIVAKAQQFYGHDTNCPTAYEPSGEDFISPCLAEADLMRRVLPAKAFALWLRDFLPGVGSNDFAPLRTPIEVRDRKDPKIGHLIGLAFQRAWCFEGIAQALPEKDPRRVRYLLLAAAHRDAGLAQMFDSGYGGSHWLASFAIYLLTGTGGTQ